MVGGFPGTGGGGPDIKQILQIARTILTILENGDGEGSFTTPTVGGDGNDVETNVVARMMRGGRGGRRF